jgi:hypothetical protein
MTVHLSSWPRQLRWPELCANCGAPAAERIPIAKAFARTYVITTRRVDDPFKFSVPHFDVPFCGTCASRHRQLAVTVSPIRHALSYVSSIYTLGVIISAIGIGLYFFPIELHGGGADITMKLTLEQVGFLVLAMRWCGWIAWYCTRRLRMPPQTEITRAFDFDDWKVDFFTGRQRTYRIRSEAFANAFRALNH